MRGVLLEVPPSLLEERRRLGIDLWDEMWEGVIHLVPAPSRWHQQFVTELALVLGPIAKAKGLLISHETALYRSEKDYRIPDLVCALPSQGTERGIEGGCEFAVEALSPNDETYDKIPWYASFGLRELLIVDPVSRQAELRRLEGGKLVPVELHSRVLDVTFALAPGPRFEIRWPGGSASI